MVEERVIIQPPISRSQRVDGWAIVGIALVMMNLLCSQTGELAQALFPTLVLVLLFAMALILGIRQALETQKWIAGRDYFECRSRLLGLKWSRTLRAEA